MDSSLVAARISDAVRLCNNASFPKFVGFLRPEEVVEAKSVAEKLGCKFCFFGGYESAQRLFFGAFPDWCNDFDGYFPITPVTILLKDGSALSHRHFLGARLSLGIKREAVGDILIEKGRAVAFLSSEIAPFVKEQLTKVANVGVVVTEGFTASLPGMSGFETLSATVASSRLDCVVSALIKSSRSRACDLIAEKLVSVNSILTEKTVKTVFSGDTVTIRGKGKFIIESLDGRTKKDRIILVAKKYI